MVSSPQNSTPENPVAASTSPQGKSGSAEVSAVDQAALDYTIQVAKNFSRRTAHDFNNLIAVMQGFASILQNRLRDDENNRGLAEQIELSAQEALKLTSWMSTFANNNPRQLVEIDVNQTMGEFIAKAKAELSPLVQVQVELCPERPKVVCDEVQLERICQQLWWNAVEAMPDGGTLCWQTSLERMEQGDSSAAFLRLRVQDSGEGMDETVRQSMFDPFFTTKVGKDRGLGLTMIYDAVNAHQGMIAITSEPQLGTCVDVYLPAVEGVSAQEEPDASSSQGGGRRQVLVVDDEEIIQVLVRELLKGQDLDVVGVGSGEDAIKTYRNSQGAIKVVILDMTLPGMDGVSTFNKLREMDPQVKVIVSSGDPHQPAVRTIMAAGAFGMLAKPFSPDHLTDVVERALR